MLSWFSVRICTVLGHEPALFLIPAFAAHRLHGLYREQRQTLISSEWPTTGGAPACRSPRPSLLPCDARDRVHRSATRPRSLSIRGHRACGRTV